MSPDSEYPDPEAGRSQPVATTLEEEYPNYKPHFLLILAHVVVFLILALVVGLTPNTLGTGIVQIREGKVYIGVVQSCQGGGCEGWFATGDRPSSEMASGATSRRGLERRAGLEEIFPLAAFYLTTGLASLFCFYMSLWSLIFLFIRIMFRAPTPPDPAKVERRHWRIHVKVLAYRACRIMVFFEFWTILGVAGDSTKRALQVRSKMRLVGADGIGGGAIALHIAWIILFYAWLVEWSAPKGKLHAGLTPGCFGCLPCCSAGTLNGDGREEDEIESEYRGQQNTKTRDEVTSPDSLHTRKPPPARMEYTSRKYPMGRVPARRR